ncbi:xylulokinase [Haloechinothrix salitolerans]|uniref:Xylulose kinase n=1 Tax=Haloechinothrix salitolerans TaxID=926830 RepID=A0ABW2C4C7_9PSEU
MTLRTGPLVAGIDSSTQSCKVVVVDADTGAVVREARAPHPDTTEVDPRRWWDAWTEASAGLLDDVRALAVAGQQHGLVALDGDGAVVRPALLWHDTRSADAASDLVSEFGGPAAWADAVGSVPVASFTVTKLRWVAEHEPALAARIERVLLPHDWLTWRLLGGRVEPVTDAGDASGTGYWSPAEHTYRDDVVSLAFGAPLALPRVAAPSEVVGELDSRTIVAPGTGDNMGAALGLGAGPGDVIVSVGTSGTVFAVHSDSVADASGTVAGFADATGRFLPLVCTLNAARVLGATARMLGTDLDGLDRLALAANPGADGLVLLPYLDGERTPNLPDAAGSLHGLRRDTMTPENVARAAVEGMLCGLADGLDALRALEVDINRILLVGGGARSAAVREAAPTVLGAPVTVPEPGEYVAIGAARQAAWALAGTPEPPHWPLREATILTGIDRSVGDHIRDRYAATRHSI